MQNAEISREQLALGREQWTDAKARQARFDPLFEQIINSSLESQRTQDGRSAALFDEWEGASDIRESFYDDARNYDTPGRRAEAGAAARAGVETEANMQRQAQQRMIGRSGGSISSPHALALDNSMRLGTARASAGADTAARRAVETTGFSLRDNAAKTSMGLPSTGLQAASLGLGAGGAAGGALTQQQGTYNASMTPTLGLFQGASNANAQSGSLFSNIAQIQGNNQQGGLAGLAGLGQAAGVMYGSGMFSSKKLKEPVRDATRRPKRHTLGDVEDARITSETPVTERMADTPPVEAWRYKGQAGRTLGSDVHVGEYAEDAQAAFGDDVAPDGEMIDVAAATKRNAAAIAELGRVAQRLEAELGIAA